MDAEETKAFAAIAPPPKLNRKQRRFLQKNKKILEESLKHSTKFTDEYNSWSDDKKIEFLSSVLARVQNRREELKNKQEVKENGENDAHSSDSVDG